MRTLHDGTEVPDETPVMDVNGKLYLHTPEETARIAALAAEQPRQRPAPPPSTSEIAAALRAFDPGIGAAIDAELAKRAQQR